MKPTTSKWMMLIALMVMDLLAGAEFDLFVPSFPELQQQFHISPFWVEALLSVNFIGYCVSLFFVGELADRYGRRPVLLYGLLIFTLGCLCCLGIPSYPLLLLGRLLQGVGVAAPAILSFLIVADTYSLKDQQYWISFLNAVMNITAATAPIVGSYVTLYWHWPGNFMVLGLLGCTALLMTFLYVPSTQPAPQNTPTPSQQGYLEILSNPSLRLLMAHMTLLFLPYWVFVGISPLLYMQDLHVSLTHFGYYQGVLALVFGIGCALFGRLNTAFDQKKMLIVTGYILLFSCLSTGWAAYTNSKQPLLLTLAFIPFIVGQIIPSNILYPLCLHLMPQAKGRIASIIQSGRLVLCALSLELAGYCYHGSFQKVGIILVCLIFSSATTLFFVLRDPKVTQHL